MIFKIPVQKFAVAFRLLLAMVVVVVFISSIAQIQGCASSNKNTSSPNQQMHNQYEPYNTVKVNYYTNKVRYRGNGRKYKLISSSLRSYDLAGSTERELVHDILKSLGWQSSENPDMTIIYDASYLGSDEIEHSIPYDIKGQVGYSSSNTTGQISSFGNITATTTYVPKYGTVGSGEYKYSTYLHSYSVRLEAYDSNSLADNKPEQLWKIDAITTGSIIERNVAIKSILIQAKPLMGSAHRANIEKTMYRSEILKFDMNSLTEDHFDAFVNESRIHFDNLPEDKKRAMIAKADQKVKDILRNSHNAKSPRAYRNNDNSMTLKTEDGEWIYYCQNNEKELVGCGMMQGDLVVFIMNDGNGTVIVAGNRELKPGSRVCVYLDEEIMCLDAPPESDKEASISTKGIHFGEKTFWKIEKSKHAKVSFFARDVDKDLVKQINMKDYNNHLNKLRSLFIAP